MAQAPRNIFQDLIDIASGDLGIANTQVAELTRLAERGDLPTLAAADDGPEPPAALPRAPAAPTLKQP